MKNILTLIAAMALLCSSASAQIKKNARVYICTGKAAKSYHLSQKCDALKSCKGEVKQISMAEAIKKGRHLCKYCKGNAKK